MNQATAKTIGARSGFTYIDLVVTVLIIGILAAVVGPRFAVTLHRTRASSAAERIATDLGYARQVAISRSATIAVQFTTSSESYTIPGISDINRPSQNYLIDLDAPPYACTLESASLGGDAEVVFDRFGVPDSGGTITVASGGVQQTVTLDAITGRASLP